MTRHLLLLHGLLRTPLSMRVLARAASSHGWEVSNIGYRSRHEPVAELARTVRDHADSLRCGQDEVSIVAHSLGGLVARAAMGDGWRRGRAVLLGTPNGGAIAASVASRFPLASWIFGPCLTELLPCRAAGVAPADVPTLVIAGGTGRRGWNTLLPGDNDGIVRVQETKLASAAFSLVHCPHTFLPMWPAAIETALAFLDARDPFAASSSRWNVP